jgi:hypothetical protein
MPNAGPKIELRRLEAFFEEVEARYLKPHVSSNTFDPPSRGEQLDVAAFVVLIHGAFENFIEGLTIWMASRIESNWIKRRRVSRSTAALLFHAKCNVDYESDARTAFDMLRGALASAQVERSAAVKANNGTATAHLRSLLVPLGVDIPNDPVLVASLEALVAMRHEWAHQYRFGVRTPRGARDVKQTADDCLGLARQLAANIGRMRL